MAGEKQILTVKVSIWGLVVGHLYWDERRNTGLFSYDKDFLKSGYEVSPLDHPLSDPSSRLTFSGLKEKPYNGLPPFLADSLPDDWGNLVFQVASPKPSMTKLERLSYIGKRGMGAFEFAPESPVGIKDSVIEIKALKELADKIYKERSEAVITPEEELTRERLRAIGTSAGGRMPKAIIAIDDKGEIRSGQVANPDRFRYCILKFQTPDHPYSCRIEMAYYHMATTAGIRMSRCELLPIEGEYHFLTERFDRERNEKVHTQTLAAMAPGVTSYEEFFQVCRRLELPYVQLEQLFRRMVFNVFSCTTDDHIKNYSFLLRRGGKWELSPAYDLTFTLDLSGLAIHHTRCLSIKGKYYDITEEDLVAFAREQGIKEAGKIIDQVSLAVCSFYENAVKEGVSNYWIETIEREFSKVIPERHLHLLTHHQGIICPEYTDESGHLVADIKLEETISHDIKISANIDGRTVRRVLGHKKAETKQILETGCKTLPLETIKELVGRYLIPML